MVGSRAGRQIDHVDGTPRRTRATHRGNTSDRICTQTATLHQADTHPSPTGRVKKRPRKPDRTTVKQQRRPSEARSAKESQSGWFQGRPHGRPPTSHLQVRQPLLGRHRVHAALVIQHPNPAPRRNRATSLTTRQQQRRTKRKSDHRQQVKVVGSRGGHQADTPQSHLQVRQPLLGRHRVHNRRCARAKQQCEINPPLSNPPSRSP